MTSIKVLKAVGGHDKGATINTTAGAAAFLIEGGYAEAVEVEAKASRGRASKPADSKGGGDSPAESAFTAG